MEQKKIFNNLIKISIALYVLVLLMGIMLKAIMPNDLIANYEFLSSMTINDRMIRGLRIFEFYKIEYELGIITRTVILDILNMIVFVPVGILVTHFLKNNRVLKASIISFIFALFIEIFQLITIIGAFMLNDLIINIIGSIIGSLIYIFATKSEKYKIYNILLIIFIFVSMILSVYLVVNFISNINIYIDIFSRKL